MSWPTAWSYNFCPNPSAEVDLTGYATLLGTEQVSQYPLGYAGTQSVQVVTPGSVQGEGISTPAGTVLASVTGSASVWIYGETGNLTVQALQNPGGAILATTFVRLDGSGWVRAELTNLPMTATATFYLAIFTTIPQALTFQVDAVQYEPYNAVHPYIDGSLPYATWTGTAGESASYQLYQNPISLDGGMVMEGSLTAVAQGEIFQAGMISGFMDMSGVLHDMAAATTAGVTVIPPAIDTGVPGQPWLIEGGGSFTVAVVNPAGLMSSFAVFETGVDPDPAMTLIGWNNAGTQNANSSATAYTRLFGTFSPPQQSLAANGTARWQAAAYMAAGFRISSQPAWTASAPGAVHFLDVQVEKSVQQGPTGYQLPRSLNTIIKPSRINYCTNPSMEVSASGWTAIGGSTVVQVGTSVAGFGTHSLECSAASSGDGVKITISNLIMGDTYAASAYIAPDTTNINDIIMEISGGHAVTVTSGASISTSSVIAMVPYGSGEYGSGAYGGLFDATVAMPGSAVFRPFTAFVANASTVTLSFTPVAVTGASYPLTFQVDAVLIEPGEVLNPYGDGSTPGWEWELGGTAGLSRSYYYDREATGVNVVGTVLQQHIPLGLTAYEPEYFVVPSQ